ncbi:MAG: aminomethyltransferase family protein, partial [Deltaproteobacteria bacterium]|nr:aminomethyltransferase family protein [Deltaproteobacteria bacterium]
IEIQATRLSFIGESGWELTCRKEDVHSLYKTFADAGAKPAGLYAQSSMRIEKKFMAIGHDLDSDITPLEAGLEFAVDFNTDFIGRDALLSLKKKPIQSSLVLIVLNNINAVPLGNEPVSVDGNIVGKTTSAAFGYRVGKPVAIALLKRYGTSDFEGLEVEINIAGEMFSGKVSTAPAFDPEGLLMRAVSK